MVATDSLLLGLFLHRRIDATCAAHGLRTGTWS
jgi:hypothetical protein